MSQSYPFVIRQCSMEQFEFECIAFRQPPEIIALVTNAFIRGGITGVETVRRTGAHRPRGPSKPHTINRLHG